MNWILSHPYESLVSLLTVTTSIATVAHLAIPALAKWAESTPGDTDDKLVAKWGARIDAVIAVLDVLRRCMPRVVIGPTLRTQPLASVAGRPTIPSLAPMKPLSSPPPPRTTLKPWPDAPVTPIDVPADMGKEPPK